jgi:hypothetical protein
MPCLGSKYKKIVPRIGEEKPLSRIWNAFLRWKNLLFWDYKQLSPRTKEMAQGFVKLRV